MASERLIENPATPKATPTARNGRGLGRWTMVVLILLAFVLRIYDLGGQELWFDEALSAHISGLGWAGTLAYVYSSPFEHPPLYYLSLYLWQQFVGTSEFALRFYSVFWGMLFIPLFYILVKRLANERLALLATLLAAFSPFMVAYSQDARMYTLLPCLAVLTLLAFWNALEREGQPAWWLAYFVLLFIGVATHYFFAMVWVVTTLYLLLEVLRRRPVRAWVLVIQALLPLATVVWVIGTPGLRASLLRIGQGQFAFGIAYKLDKVVPSLILAEIEGGQVPVVVYVLALGGWVLVLLGVWWSRRARILGWRTWRLLTLFLVVPLAGSLLIPYGVLGRHLGYILIPAFAFMALGLLALQRRGYFALTIGVLAVLLPASYGLVAHYTSSNGNLGEAMAYINRRGQPGDLLIMTQPLQWPLVAYYNDEGWPVQYLPPINTPLTQATVGETLRTLGQAHDRLWLGPVGAWTADPESLVEQWLTARAFQAEKAWFPDSTSVALYLPDDGTVTPAESRPLTWGGLIGLTDLETGLLRLQPGDAIRLRFYWQAAVDLDERYEVRLLLVDDQGLVWAERRSEPCGSWCPTDKWQAGVIQVDQHALVIPPGTPPGTYQLQVAWNPLDGSSPLLTQEGSQHAGQATLAEVTILPSDQATEPWERSNSLGVTFGGELTLLGYQPATAEARPGESLSLETHWRAETAPKADYALLVELVDEQGQVAANWRSTPSVVSYPTSRWQPGEYVRGQLNLPLPGNMPLGRYQLQIALAALDGKRLEPTGHTSPASRVRGQDLVLASVRVLDRPRRFDLPSVSTSLDATVGRQAHLVGYDLDLSQNHPGGQLPLTLYWLAGGPMVRPYKVFAHLVDAENRLRAQYDAPPAGECCPADTWAEGEVIVDPHPIALGVDLPPGTYQLVVGMYDPESEERVPAYDAAGNSLVYDRVPVREVLIVPGAANIQSKETSQPRLDFDYAIFIPFVAKDRVSN